MMPARWVFAFAVATFLASACSGPEIADDSGVAEAQEVQQAQQALRLAPAPAALAPGQSATVLIASATYWNKTGVMLDADVTYRFETLPGAVWTDWFIRTGADGFLTDDAPAAAHAQLAAMESQRRMPGARWFALTGAIGSTEQTAFVIGSSATVRAAVAGELTAFANDVPGYYDNNRGSLLLRITRVP